MIICLRCWTTLVFLIISATQGLAEKLSLDLLSVYLNSILTAETTFSQINDDGSISTGKFFIRRPGRLRFEYDPPSQALVLASGGRLAIFDAKGNPNPEIWPLNRTPLSLILHKTIDLENSPMVASHVSKSTATIVRAQDPKHPDRGSVDLMFVGPEPALRQWTIRDSSGGSTTIILGDIATSNKLSSSLFDIQRTIENRQN